MLHAAGTHDHYQYRMDKQSGYLLLRKLSCYCDECRLPTPPRAAGTAAATPTRYEHCAFRQVVRSQKHTPRASDGWSRVQMKFKKQRGMYELRGKSAGERAEFIKKQHPGLFIAVYTKTDTDGFRWWLAQLHGATKKHSKTVLYKAPKGSREWGYKKNENVLNVTWLDRSKPAEDPLVFKGCPESGSQIIPLSMLLPVDVPVQQSALGTYTITAGTADLINEWCDHVAEIT